MSSTVHFQPSDHQPAHSSTGKLTTTLIAAAMLALGFGLGSSDRFARAPGHTATGSPSVAAPAGARIYDDWRGNSAGRGAAVSPQN